MTNWYEDKQERRRDRLEARAEKLAREGAARIASGWDRLRQIPFGQPILVGHHSEQRDRNYRRKAGNAIDKGMELQKAAGEAAARADSVGKGGISSDDPEAIRKLKAELEILEARQAKMVQTNKLLRKGDFTGLSAMGYGASEVYALRQPDFCGRIGFADFELKNNGANIRRIKLRIEALGRMATRGSKTTERPDGIRIVENVEINRVQIFFPGKPPGNVRAILKRWGWRWSPSEGAWQRHLNNRGDYDAVAVLEQIGKEATCLT